MALTEFGTCSGNQQNYSNRTGDHLDGLLRQKLKNLRQMHNDEHGKSEGFARHQIHLT